MSKVKDAFFTDTTRETETESLQDERDCLDDDPAYIEWTKELEAEYQAADEHEEPVF